MEKGKKTKYRIFNKKKYRSFPKNQGLSKKMAQAQKRLIKKEEKARARIIPRKKGNDVYHRQGTRG